MISSGARAQRRASLQEQQSRLRHLPTAQVAAFVGPQQQQQQPQQQLQLQSQQQHRQGDDAPCKLSANEQRQQTAMPTRASDDATEPTLFERLAAFDAFRKLHPTVLRNLCELATLEHVDAGVISK